MDQRIIDACKAQAPKYDIPLPRLLAFVQIESNGDAFDPVAGQDRALIRWEGHYFWRRLRDSGNETAWNAAVDVGLADKRVGGVPNPRSQEGRYAILEAAANLCMEHGLDPDMAYECVSIGLGQVMGAHWKDLGYSSAQRMLDEAHDETAEKDIADQIAMILKFCESNNVLPDIRSGRWAAAAEKYNGPRYAMNRYDVRLAEAEAMWSAVLDGGPPTGPVLRAGHTGPFVIPLQVRLDELGYAVGDVDGIFGSMLRAAVLAFQADNGLKTDGVVGPATWRAMDVAQPRPVGESRRNATVDDLRRQGSTTIQQADEATNGGIITGGLGVGGLGAWYIETLESLSGGFDKVKDAVSGMSDQLGWLVPLILLGVGGYVWWRSQQVKKNRLKDHREARNLGR